MDILQEQKIIMFLIFFVPGFISLKIYDLIVPRTERDFSKSIFEVVTYSSFNYAGLFWLILIIHSNNFYDEHRLAYYLTMTLIVFIFPVLWPILIYMLLSSKTINKLGLYPTIPKPWDYVFGKRESFWIIIHLKDGAKIGGVYNTDSFASSYPKDEQIYIEEIWNIDEEGKFMTRKDHTAGAIISSKDIAVIELFKSRQMENER